MEKLTDGIIQYANARKKEYEEKYHIQILMWCVRKSFSRGLDRRVSDLDLAFIFQSMDQSKKNIIFERADRRIEIQCWDIQDILEIITENKRLAMEGKEFSPYYKSNDFKHYILDYYNGFYVGWQSELAQFFYSFERLCGTQIKNLYEPYVIARMFLLTLKEQIQRIQIGYYLSLNEYLNAIWMGMAGIHMLRGGNTSNIPIQLLAPKYLSWEHSAFILRLAGHFKGTIQKQSNYCNREDLNSLIHELYIRLEEEMESYQIIELDIKKEFLDIQENLKEIRKAYENAGC